MDFRLVSGVFRFGFWKTALYLLSLERGGSTRAESPIGVPLAACAPVCLHTHVPCPPRSPLNGFLF